MDYIAPDEDEKGPVVAAVSAAELEGLGVTAKKAKEMTTNLTKASVKVLNLLRTLVDMAKPLCAGEIGQKRGKILFEFAQARGPSTASVIIPLLFAHCLICMVGPRGYPRGQSLPPRKACIERRNRREAKHRRRRDPPQE